MPKQFVRLLGIPMLWWSVMAFHEEDPATAISVVMHPGFFDDYDIMVSELPESLRSIPVRLVAGGSTRGESVANGLMGLPADGSLVSVHDAARPLLTKELISRGWECATAAGTAVPVCPVSDSIREILNDGESRAVDRSRYVSVQTPQVFKAQILKEAYELPELPGHTDDASRVETAGYPIALYEGLPDNLKVTNPGDFAIAETLLRLRG